MNASTESFAYRNQRKAQVRNISLFSRIFVAILLAAVLVPWAAGSASPAFAGEVARPGCETSLYWEIIFTELPNNPAAQSGCLPATVAAVTPVVSASLYWEYFLTASLNGPQIAQFFTQLSAEEAFQP
jgi:hypothetical protein